MEESVSQSINEPLDEQKPLNYSFWVGALILKGSATPKVLADVLKFGLIAFCIVLASIFME